MNLYGAIKFVADPSAAAACMKIMYETTGTLSFAYPS